VTEKDDKKMPQKTKSNRKRIPQKLITIKTEFLEHTYIVFGHAIPNSSISKTNVEPPGMPGWENLPYPISAGIYTYN